MNILLAGATGFVGTELVKELAQETPAHSLRILTRNPSGRVSGDPAAAKFVAWGDDLPEHLGWADAVVNLAGAGVADSRWTKERKEELHESRIGTTRRLVEALRRTAKRPEVLVNASAVGYYGRGFLRDLCVEWEKSATEARVSGLRVVRLRFGAVLDDGGGVMGKMLPPFRMFVGGPLGSGKQPFAWIHRADAVAAIKFVVTNDLMEGPVNVTAPQSVTMNEFAKALGRVMGRPAVMRVPEWALKLLFGEMATIMTEGQDAPPDELLAAGFKFRYSDLDSALKEIVN